MRRLTCLALLASSSAAFADPPPADAIDAYHAALKAQDSAAALKLLADDALLFEQGFVERKDQYAGAHIAQDAAFAAATGYRVLDRRIIWIGDRDACVITQARTTGQFDGRALDLVGTETALLERVGEVWLIRHLHSSAHPAEAAPERQPGPAPSSPAKKKKPKSSSRH
jgi:ketosteroid isomerase-like protein